MFSICKDLCGNKKDKGAKKDKKDKHGGKDGGKEEGKQGKHKMKNVYTFTAIGQGKKNTDQDSASLFEIIEDNTMVRFFGVYDGHGDFGKEASILANNDFENFIRANVKKILKFRDQRDYKERVKKLLK